MGCGAVQGAREGLSRQGLPELKEADREGKAATRAPSLRGWLTRYGPITPRRIPGGANLALVWDFVFRILRAAALTGYRRLRTADRRRILPRGPVSPGSAASRVGVSPALSEASRQRRGIRRAVRSGRCRR